MIRLRTPPPDTLERGQFWAYVQTTYGLTPEAVIAALDAAVAATAMTQAERDRLSIKVLHALSYDRLDADLLPMAFLLGLDADTPPIRTQADVDAAFRAAAVPVAPVPALFVDPISGSALNAGALDLSAAGWTNNANITLTALDPAGAYLAPQRITDTAGELFRGRTHSLGTLTAGVSYRASVVCRIGPHGRAVLQINSPTTQSYARVQSVSPASLTGSHASTGAAVVWTDLAHDALAGGWARLRATFEPVATGEHFLRVGPLARAAGDWIDAYGAGVALAA